MPDTGGAEKAAASGAHQSTKEERIDFLHESIAFTEGNIRAYDTKAEISLAAFALSAHPLWLILKSLCPHMAAKPGLAAIVLIFMLVIVLYLYVLWPIGSPGDNLTSGLQSNDLFYVKDPLGVGSASFMEKLKTLSVENELTAEALKLAYIRSRKHVRFKIALVATFAFYAVVASVFLLTRATCS